MIEHFDHLFLYPEIFPPRKWIRTTLIFQMRYFRAFGSFPTRERIQEHIFSFLESSHPHSIATIYGCEFALETDDVTKEKTLLITEKARSYYHQYISAEIENEKSTRQTFSLLDSLKKGKRKNSFPSVKALISMEKRRRKSFSAV